MGCLYRVTFPNGKAYIGITIFDAETRFNQHVRSSYSGKSNLAMSNALRKHGKEKVTIETLMISDCFLYLQETEKKAIKVFNTRVPFGYNLTDGGEGVLGYKHTEKTRAILSEKRKLQASPIKGRKFSEESKNRLSASRTGFKVSEETKIKISKTSKGNANSKGYRHTDEAKRKIKESNLNRLYAKGYRHTESAKQKISKANIGRVSAMKGKSHTLEAINKISNAHKSRFKDPLVVLARSLQTATYWAIKNNIPICLLKDRPCAY